VSTRATRFTGAVAALVMAGTAAAQSDNPWDGVYAGLNLGSASHTACSAWSPQGAAISPPPSAGFDNRICTSGGAFTGGIQVGDNFQFKHVFWGMSVDLDIESASDRNQQLNYAGGGLPTGTYTASGKPSPEGFAILAPRFGYASRQWLAYVRAGGIVAFGSRDRLDYTPVGVGKTEISFEGDRSFASAAFVGGGGVEWGFNGAWSLAIEYLHANFGAGSRNTATCTGSASACAPLSGISFVNTHSALDTNIVRVGINYWFGYWQP
jgi:opacity protein-like surface antigen